MGNTLIAFPDRTMEAATTFSGGVWNAVFPLLNLQNALLSKVARSVNALAGSTQWLETFATPRDVRVIAILGHNISLAGTIRVQGYSDAGLTQLVYDTGVQFAWPQTFTADDVAVQPNNWIFPLPTVATAKYWKVEIVDTANTAGYVQLGRCWLGPAFEPAAGISSVASLGYVSGDVIVSSPVGVDWGSRREQRRSGAFNFDILVPAEKRIYLMMQKSLGKTGEVLWVYNRAAGAEDMLLESFPAKIKQASPITYPYFNNIETSFEILETV